MPLLVSCIRVFFSIFLCRFFQKYVCFKNFIGTDATHADHIEKVKERQYIGVQGNGKLVPGTLGIALCDGYDSIKEISDMGCAMSKPNLRAELEADLKGICEGNFFFFDDLNFFLALLSPTLIFFVCSGTKNADTVLSEQVSKYRQVFRMATSKAFKIAEACAKYLNDGGG